MTPTEVMGFILTLLVMLVGMAGAALPGLPGTPLIFLAALGHRLCFGDQSASRIVVFVLGILTVASLALDFLATTYGAKRLGATWRGITGALLGAVAGLFVLPPWGLVLLPLACAAAAEMVGGRPWKEAGRAGLGAALGVVAGTAGRIAFSLAMVALWISSILWHLMKGAPSAP